MSSVRISSGAELIWMGSARSTFGDLDLETYLACYSSLEENGGVVVNELELFEDIYTRVVIGQKLQILIGKREFQRR